MSITLKSSDDVVFVVDEAVALEMLTIRPRNEVDPVDVIPLPNVTGRTLSKVIEYCKKHVEPNGVDEELKAWDADFVKVDQATLFDLIQAGNNLGIKSLVNLTVQTVADRIKGKTVEEIFKTFNIRSDVTPEE